MYTTEALRILDQHDPNVPIYMYLAYHVVHTPLEVTKDYYDINSQILNTNRRTFAAMMTSLDDAVGNITAKLKEKKMWDNTVFIFTADNGAALTEDDVVNNGGNNYPLRGGKFTYWQGGVRASSFITSPLLPAASTNMTWKGMMHAVDWYTTVASLAKASLENTGPLPPDGFDMWNALSQGSSSPRVEMVLNIWGNNSGAIRVGDYKLLYGYPGSPDYWLQPPKIEKSPSANPCQQSPCLFNVIEDPTEHNDLAPTMPDKVRELLNRYWALADSEVTLAKSGLCPPAPAKGWPHPFAVNKASGFWQPWADDV